MPKDADGFFVHKVENGLWELYREMAGPDAKYVNETDFEREIRACVLCFYWERNRHDWVNRKIKDAAGVHIIETDIRGRLAEAATMQAGKEQCSLQVQMDFQNLYDYVREWLGEAATETRGAGKGGSMQELLDALKKLIERYEQPV
jgi:hypothetical protein